MATQKITFKIKSIDKSGPLEVTIEDTEFITKEGKKAAEKIFFVGSPDKWENIKNTLESKKSDGTENKTFELEYDESDLEVEKDANLNMCFSSASGSKPAGPEPRVNHKINSRKELRIWELNLIKISASQGGDTNKPEQPKSNDNQNTPPPGNEEKKQPGPNQEDNKSPNKDNPQQPEPKDTPDSPQDKKTPDQPPKNPEPSSEQIKQASDELDRAKNSNNKEDIKNSLNKTNDTVRKSSDKDLKKKKEEAEKRLGELDKEELRKQVRNEVNDELKRLGIKPEDLSSVKQKFDELNNNNNNNIEPTKAQEIRTEVLNEAAKKKFNELITKLEEAIKRNDKKEIESKSQELTTLTQDNSDYVQKAYEAQKSKIQQLLEKGKKNQSPNQNNENDGFFRLNNPVMWISGVAIIGLVVGVVLIARSRRKKVLIK